MQDNTTDKELLLRVLQDYSRDKALALQAASSGMTGYESTINNNVWSPDTYPQGWTELGPVGGSYIEEDA